MLAGTQTFGGQKTFNPAPFFTSLLARGVCYMDSSQQLASKALTSGQLLIGSTGADPVAESLTGTTDQVIVGGGAGAIALSLPQSIAATSTPAFSGLSSGDVTTYSVGTVTQSGTTVTGSGTTFTAAMAGGLLVLANGETTVIQTFNSATSLTVYKSQTITLASVYACVYPALSSSVGYSLSANGHLCLRTRGRAGVATTGMSLHLVSTGSGSSYNIDILTYVSPFTTGAGGQMRFTDNSFGVDWAYYSKIQGADANALQQLFRIAANKTISTFNNTPTGTAQFLGAVTMSSLTASSLVYSNASKALVSATLTNGQLLIQFRL